MSKIEDTSKDPAQSACALQDNELDAVSGALNFCKGGFIIDWRAGGNPTGTHPEYKPTESLKLLP